MTRDQSKIRGTLYISIYIYIEIRNKQVTPAEDLLGYHKRPPVKWKPLTSPYVWGESGKNLRFTETSSHFQNHHGVTTLYRIPSSKILNGVRKGAGTSRRTVKWYQEVRGGGVQIAGGENEEDGEERQIEKRKRGGEKLVTRRPKRGRNPLVACGA